MKGDILILYIMRVQSFFTHTKNIRLMTTDIQADYNHSNSSRKVAVTEICDKCWAATTTTTIDGQVVVGFLEDSKFVYHGGTKSEKGERAASESLP